MKFFLFTLLLGTIIAIPYARSGRSHTRTPPPRPRESLQAIMQDDDIARMAKWGHIFKRALAGVNHAINGKLAQLQHDGKLVQLQQDGKLAQLQQDDDDASAQLLPLLIDAASQLFG